MDIIFIKSKGTKCSLSKILLKIIYILLKVFFTPTCYVHVCVSVCGYSCTISGVWRSEATLQKSVFFFYHVGSGYGTWVINLGEKDIHLCCHFIDANNLLLMHNSGFLSLFVLGCCWNDTQMRTHKAAHSYHEPSITIKCKPSVQSSLTDARTELAPISQQWLHIIF